MIFFSQILSLELAWNTNNEFGIIWYTTRFYSVLLKGGGKDCIHSG